MREKFLPSNKNFWSWAMLTGLLFVFVALAPQFDLINQRGADWNGIYAVSEFDEHAYQAYVQSIIDGKPRRNSPFSGRTDVTETPQMESLFSIQFFSTYPLAWTARALGLNGSQAMMLLSAAAGFLSAFAIFSLFYHFFRNGPLAFVGTATVLFTGALVAGQGSLIAFIAPDAVHYYFSMMFLRRTNPATSFPALFLFFLFAFQFVVARPGRLKIGFGAAALGCFAFTVYSYFYHWTTALAWFAALSGVWMIFNFKRFKKDLVYLVGFGAGLVLVLIPWAVMLSHRAPSMDAAQLLVYTRRPDLWRIPTILSYLTIAALLFLARQGRLSVHAPKFIFLLSFALVSPVVFNQQIFTGHSLQPFHYQYFCANYIAAFAFIAVFFEIGRRAFEVLTFHKVLVLLAGAVLFLGYFDILSSIYLYRKQNVWRDELYPVAARIRNENLPNDNPEHPPVIMPFDFSHGDYLDGEDLPGMSSQPVLWAPHLPMFPDIDWSQNVAHFNKFLYFQNFTPERVSKELKAKNGWLLYGYFGPGRVSELLTPEYKPVSEAEINEIADKYQEFCRAFDYDEAQKPALSFVLVHTEFENDLTNVDRWYERGEGERIGKYVLYRVKLRPRP